MIVWLRYDMYRSLFCCVERGRKIPTDDEKSVFSKGYHSLIDYACYYIQKEDLRHFLPAKYCSTTRAKSSCRSSAIARFFRRLIRSSDSSGKKSLHTSSFRAFASFSYEMKRCLRASFMLREGVSARVRGSFPYFRQVSIYYIVA